MCKINVKKQKIFPYKCVRCVDKKKTIMTFFDENANWKEKTLTNILLYAIIGAQNTVHNHIILFL